MRSFYYKIQSIYRRFNYKSKIIFLNFSLNRLSNLIKSEIQYRQKREKITASPKIASIEITNICNLRCASCPTSTRTSERVKKFMSFAEFKKIIDKIDNDIFSCAIGVNGEPFLNKDIFKMIRYLKNKNIGSMVESNFNLLNENYIGEIIDSGLEILSVSIDGASAESYSKYRVGGNFENVISNLKKLVQIKRERNLNIPFIQWQFIVMKQNEHEIEKVKKMAQEIGVDTIRWDLPYIPLADYWFFYERPDLTQRAMEEYAPLNNKFRIREKDRFRLLNCNQPFQEIQVLVDGTIIPCCRLREKGVNFGNILNSSFEEIWNNNNFRSFRKQLKEQGNKPRCDICLKKIKNSFNDNI